MKKLLIILAILAFIAGVGVMKTEAATDTIEVTVTLQNISVSVSPASWDMSTTPIAPGAIVVKDPCIATNNGNVQEDLTIAVADSTNWTAGAAKGVNVFAMDLGPAGGPSYTTNIITAGVTLTNDLAKDGLYNFGLEFNAPTAGSVFTTQTIIVTVTAVAG